MTQVTSHELIVSIWLWLIDSHKFPIFIKKYREIERKWVNKCWMSKCSFYFIVSFHMKNLSSIGSYTVQNSKIFNLKFSNNSVNRVDRLVRFLTVSLTTQHESKSASSTVYGWCSDMKLYNVCYLNLFIGFFQWSCSGKLLKETALQK